MKGISLKYPDILVFLSYQKNLLWTENRIRIIHCKRGIDVRAVEVLLYIHNHNQHLTTSHYLSCRINSWAVLKNAKRFKPSSASLYNVDMDQFLSSRIYFIQYPIIRNCWSLRKHAYSNMLKILPPKNENFQIKNSDIFHIFYQNIDCWYSLEPPRRGGSNEYPQSMFWAEIRKLMYTPVNPSFTI